MDYFTDNDWNTDCNNCCIIKQLSKQAAKIQQVHTNTSLTCKQLKENNLPTWQDAGPAGSKINHCLTVDLLLCLFKTEEYVNTAEWTPCPCWCCKTMWHTVNQAWWYSTVGLALWEYDMLNQNNITDAKKMLRKRLVHLTKWKCGVVLTEQTFEKNPN